MGGFDQAIEGASALDHRLKALVSLKAASVVNCSFCLDIGSAAARKLGVRVDELHAIADPRDSELFSARERLALDYAAALSRSPVEIEDELVSALRDEFDERELLELNYMIAWENFRARSNKGLGIGPTGFTHASRRATAEPVAAAA
jgi:AhpD family alkylhydroperoxidase